jgi:hypothetical protein
MAEEMSTFLREHLGVRLTSWQERLMRQTLADVDAVCPRCHRPLAATKAVRSPCDPTSGWCGIYGQEDHFECRKVFFLDSGELNVAAESNLTKQRVTRTPEPGVYRFVTTVQAPTIADADLLARDRLLDLLRPYGVEIVVIEAETKRLEGSHERA